MSLSAIGSSTGIEGGETDRLVRWPFRRGRDAPFGGYEKGRQGPCKGGKSGRVYLKRSKRSPNCRGERRILLKKRGDGRGIRAATEKIIAVFFRRNGGMRLLSRRLCEIRKEGRWKRKRRPYLAKSEPSRVGPGATAERREQKTRSFTKKELSPIPYISKPVQISIGAIPTVSKRNETSLGRGKEKNPACPQTKKSSYEGHEITSA